MPKYELIDYENLAELFNKALVSTLRKHSVADAFLDYWVPDADPVLGISGMVDSARIAGRSDITIRFRNSTVPEARLPELEKAIQQYAKIVLEKTGDSIVLYASEFDTSAGKMNVQSATAKAATPAYWQADMVSASQQDVNDIDIHWDSADLPEFSDVHPHFRPGLKAAFENLSCEIDGSSVDTACEHFEGCEGEVKLRLDVDPKTGVVREARHEGTLKPSEKGALDLFCKAAIGLPLQEVADHVGLKVISSLIDEDKAPPARGVLLPSNAGRPFMLAPRLARKAYVSYLEAHGIDEGTNFYYAPPSGRWQKLSSEIRVEELQGALRAFLQSNDLYPDDLELLRLDKNKYGYDVRGVIGFSDRVSVGDKPSLMRNLEKHLRKALDTEVELVADRAKDSSSLRRL